MSEFPKSFLGRTSNKIHPVHDHYLYLWSTTSLCQAWLHYHVSIMTMTRYGSPGRAQSNLKNIFNRITAFHMSLVQVSRQNTEETETEMFWKEEAALFNAFNAMLSIFMIFWVKFLSNVKNLILNKSLRLFELMVEWIDKRVWKSKFSPRRLCTKVCLSWPGTIWVRQVIFF